VSSLLRDSQAAERLTKEAFSTAASRAAWKAAHPPGFLGRVAETAASGAVGAGTLAGRGLLGAAGRIGRFAKKHPVGSLAAMGGISAAGLTAADAIRNSEGGMQYPYNEPPTPQTGYQMLLNGRYK
jgi:hypothetical protein